MEPRRLIADWGGSSSVACLLCPATDEVPGCPTDRTTTEDSYEAAASIRGTTGPRPVSWFTRTRLTNERTRYGSNCVPA